MHRNERLDDHQKFRELAVLAQRKAISDTEQLQLNNHLRVCRACQHVCDEYSLISAAGMPFLAAALDQDREAEEWDNRPAHDRLMARLRSLDDWNSPGETVEPGNARYFFYPQKTVFRWGVAVLAACVLAAIAATMYWMGVRTRVTAHQNLPVTISDLPEMAAAKDEKGQLIFAQKAQLLRIQSELAKTRHEVLRLQQAWQAAESHSAVVAMDHAKTTEQLRAASAERDKLADQLRDAEQSYQLLQAELTNLRTDHEKTLLRTTFLQKRVDELEVAVRDQERRLKDDQQYLASDRDIRELMGARKLYIADVFDVDSGSRTRKPFGRVFYTQNKSLVFYAFDLDRQPGVKTASAFQVWGQRDAEEQSHATNLGILYMDSDSNWRWVLKIDDPKQLAEIDAVFVTIEPRGGSQKPTGKPFLYALLRKEANHP
jgi:hypothetical protein